METTSNEEEIIPSWLDEAFIATALKTSDSKIDESSVKISSVQKLRGGLLGETYRVVATCGDGSSAAEIAVVVKSAPTSAGILKQILDSGVFTREKVAYGKFLTSVHDALRGVEGSMWQPLAPKLYSEGTDPTSFLVLEDLAASGFRKVSFADNLGLEHCTAVVQSIARMHAASVALIQQELYAQAVFRESLLFSRRILETQNDGLTWGFKKIVADLEDYPWFRKYSNKFETFSSNMVRYTMEVVSDCDVDFKVMVHGDLHKNNMMFRAGEEGLQVRFFDYQGLHVGSPAEDLNYFLHTSASLDVLRDHSDLLVSEYHRTLQRTLRALGLEQQADAYPLDQLRSDMDHFGMISVFCSFMILPVVLGDLENLEIETDTEKADYEEKVDKLRNNLWKNETFLEYTEWLLPLFDSKGLFDTRNS